MAAICETVHQVNFIVVINRESILKDGCRCLMDSKMEAILYFDDINFELYLFCIWI